MQQSMVNFLVKDGEIMKHDARVEENAYQSCIRKSGYASRITTCKSTNLASTINNGNLICCDLKVVKKVFSRQHCERKARERGLSG